MNLFPSSPELTVASALLLLSTAPPTTICIESRSKTKSRSKEELLQLRSFVSSDSTKSCSSSLTTVDDGSSSSSKLNPPHKVRIVSIGSLGQEMKFKMMRRKRSECRSVVIALPVTETQEDVEVSCLSSTSSWSVRKGMFCGGGGGGGGGGDYEVVQKKKSHHLRPGLRRLAEAMLNLLSGRFFSEVQIRRALGDSPDTSKALRLLIKLERIKRSGKGGRGNPYIYTKA